MSFLGDVSKLKITIESEDGLFKHEVKSNGGAVISFIVEDEEEARSESIILCDDNVQRVANLSAACHNASTAIIEATQTSLEGRMANPISLLDGLKAKLDLAILPRLIMEAIRDYDADNGAKVKKDLYIYGKEEANAEGLQTKRAHID